MKESLNISLTAISSGGFGISEKIIF